MAFIEIYHPSSDELLQAAVEDMDTSDILEFLGDSLDQDKLQEWAEDRWPHAGAIVASPRSIDQVAEILCRDYTWQLGDQGPPPRTIPMEYAPRQVRLAVGSLLEVPAFRKAIFQAINNWSIVHDTP